jgi:hypothetical protein
MEEKRIGLGIQRAFATHRAFSEDDSPGIIVSSKPRARENRNAVSYTALAKQLLGPN